MARMFQIVLIVGIIDNALKVAFVVAHLKRDGVRHRRIFLGLILKIKSLIGKTMSDIIENIRDIILIKSDIIFSK